MHIQPRRARTGAGQQDTKRKGQQATLHWRYGRRDVQPLDGWNAIRLQFWRDGNQLGFIFLLETLYLYRALVAGLDEQ